MSLSKLTTKIKRLRGAFKPRISLTREVKA